ncbi:hypothetical protein [Selenomonas sp. AE3005]|uniref:hypothetical protein n=1 Tax=Selenomonas sp. AE3005 TaxID=1485543 RepID=UPI0026010E0A|nr:hypothetical protein [Selenomonas sp. AE3005]
MNIVLSILFLAALAFAYDFFSNVYAKMLFYALFAVNLSTFVARFNLALGIVALVAACVLTPFPLAFKLFIFGSGLVMVRGGLHGRSSSMLDTIGGISILAGLILGIYGFFAG